MGSKLSKRDRVKEKVALRRTPRRPYKIVAIGLYEDQARSIDQTIQELQGAGYIKANRSLVFQTLVERFLKETDGLNQQQTLDYFLRAHIKRPLARAGSREDHREL
jgi:hypothetical protein